MGILTIMRVCRVDAKQNGALRFWGARLSMVLPLFSYYFGTENKR